MATIEKADTKSYRSRYTRSRPGHAFSAPGHDYESVTERIAGVVYLPWKKSPKKWLVGAFIAFCFVNLLMLGMCATCSCAASASGASTFPIGWGFAIINFVWWIGIGHAGTLISAILFLLKQDWRTSINRFSEAMTLFAVACAGMFPILHLGRPWLAYWLFPYPNSMWLWPQPRSPLEWDVFAVSTYGTVSLVFWYVGLIPDLASMRDTAPHLWQQRDCTAFWRSAGAVRPSTGIAIRKPTCCWPAWRRRWCFPFTPSSASTSPSASCPAGTPRFSRPTSSPAPFTPASPWC